MHMFWPCLNLSTFWLGIFKAFSEMFGTQLDPDTICALFGLTPEESRTVLPAKAYVVIAFTTLLARRLILFRWKQQAPPSFSHWVNDVMYFLKLEKIKYTLKDSLNPFSKYGGPFLTFMTPCRSPLTMNRVELIHDWMFDWFFKIHLIWLFNFLLLLCLLLFCYSLLSLFLFSYSPSVLYIL